MYIYQNRRTLNSRYSAKFAFVSRKYWNPLNDNFLWKAKTYCAQITPSPLFVVTKHKKKFFYKNSYTFIPWYFDFFILYTTRSKTIRETTFITWRIKGNLTMIFKFSFLLIYQACLKIWMAQKVFFFHESYGTFNLLLLDIFSNKR